MSSKVPVFTLGDRGVPSRQYSSSDNHFYSSYTGKSIGFHPTFSTKTDDPTGAHATYHGCKKKPGSDTKTCH